MRRRDRRRAGVAPHDVLQRVVHRERVVRALVGIARETPQEERLEIGRQPRDALARRDRRRRERLEEQLRLTLRIERKDAADHLVDDDGERIDVGATVDADAAHVLGRDVPGRAKELLVQRERRLAGELRDAEVGELHELRVVIALVLAHEQDVLGLEIAMDDAHLMRASERARHLHADAGGARPREATALDVHEQRIAFDELHDEIRDAVRLADVGNLDDVLVVDAIDGARLAQEALAMLGDERQLGTQDLDRAEPRDELVTREIHDRHAA